MCPSLKKKISKYMRFLGKNYKSDYAIAQKYFALGKKNFCCCFSYFDQFRSTIIFFKVKKPVT